MKKLSLLFLLVLALGMEARAQAKNSFADRHASFLSVSGGLSLPTGDFASTDLDNNDKAGAARPGYQVQVQYGHHFTPYIGIGVAAFYNRNNVDNDGIFGETELSGNAHFDHYQFYGATAGVLLSLPVTTRSLLGLTLATGVANVNSPRLVVNNEEVQGEQWVATMPFKVDLQYRLQLSGRLQFIGGVQYLYLKPKFTFTEDDGQVFDLRQPMSLVGVQVGLALPL